MFIYVCAFFFTMINSEKAIDIPLLDGIWELDRVNSDSIEEMLGLIGISYFKRKVISRLAVTESYHIITNDRIKLTRKTPYTYIDETYKFNIEEKIHDDIMGDVKQLVTYKTNRIQIDMAQPNNGKSVSIRSISPGDKNKVICLTNYTAPNGVKQSCVRYFIRKQ